MSCNKTEKEISECLYFTISKMFRMINRIAEEAFEKIDICPTHAFLMMLLKEEKNGLSVNQISSSLAIAPSTVTRFVDKLVSKGYVVREKMGKNSFTKITEKGLNEIDEIYEAWHGITEKIEELVGDKTYLERTKKSFKEFVEILGKDKKYDKVSEEFDFWII
ncbi:MarR family transcriptional regulator [Leptotrichia sp. oral taxon 498]|uniref:MarR family winged helix-turn-helix transcriptional regulator n=1 Tax=Leptotrichia sp. oral taxon 498 TaxID=712368 RepID=UPI000B8D0448|nr:MarR family transcriptional regulator [Leptotrichia sp. oral taxon 498]ASQ48142.1 MarR family transcriptional regulator [Leptotrichia sp. oral taxon 498]